MDAIDGTASAGVSPDELSERIGNRQLYVSDTADPVCIVGWLAIRSYIEANDRSHHADFDDCPIRNPGNTHCDR